MADQPVRDENQVDGDEDRGDPEVPSRGVCGYTDQKDAPEHANKDRGFIAEAYERAVPVLLWLGMAARSANFWTALATVVIACATIAYTVYASKQWNAMNETLNEIRKQTPLIQAQSAAAQNSVIEAQRQTRIDERPWIKFKLRDWDLNSVPPKGAQLTLTANRPFVVPVEFVNIGKTTALNVEGGVIVKLVQMGQEPSMPTAKETVVMKGEPMPKGHGTPRVRVIFPFESGTVYPGEFASVDARRMKPIGNGKMADELVSQDEIAGFAQGRKYFVVWGEVHYSDIFGTRHWTRFCVAYPFVSERCSIFNDVDKIDAIQNPN